MLFMDRRVGLVSFNPKSSTRFIYNNVALRNKSGHYQEKFNVTLTHRERIF